MKYTVGFLIVILGRMQLFTENPITTIIPLLSEFSWLRLYEVARLWSTVFFFNIIGTAIAAALGNVIGGTLIFTLLVYYQVAKELKLEKKK